MRILLYGSTGWIGGMLYDLLTAESGINVCAGQARLTDYAGLREELESIRPDRVILAAGLTGRPNVDWCEDHQQEVLDVNVIGTAVLASECQHRDIHLTYYGTGCIYEFDDAHPEKGSEVGFTEQDKPNFTGSFYSRTKIITEQILSKMDNVLVLRLRMPLSSDLHPRNFITKIIKYERVVDVQNSMTILEDLLPVGVDMTLRRLTGVYNFCNPGTISHNEILTLYRKYVDPDFRWQNFSVEEQAQILKAGRSNTRLDCSKLCALYDVEPIQQAIVRLFERIKK